MITYKIVRVKNDIVKTLFHGVNKSRVLPLNKRLKADVKQGRDGKGNRYYTTGWHTIETYESAFKYLSKFKCKQHELKIAECEIENYWPKEHSPSPILLSEFITINKIL